jgi:hypothetical protein
LGTLIHTVSVIGVYRYNILNYISSTNLELIKVGAVQGASLLQSAAQNGKCSGKWLYPEECEVLLDLVTAVTMRVCVSESLSAGQF